MICGAARWPRLSRERYDGPVRSMRTIPSSTRGLSTHLDQSPRRSGGGPERTVDEPTRRAAPEPRTRRQKISFGYVTRDVIPELLDYHAGLLCHGAGGACSNQGTGG